MRQISFKRNNSHNYTSHLRFTISFTILQLLITSRCPQCNRRTFLKYP